MNFGSIQGLVNGTETVVFDREVTGSAVSSIDTGNILNGDEDGWYTIIVRGIGVNSASMILQFNGDTANNYGYRGINATNTSVGDTSVTTGFNGIFVGSPASGHSSFTALRVYAKSGAVRLVNSLDADDINGTTVTALHPLGQVWNNTVNNIVSASLVTSGSNIGVGTRIIILKSNNFTNGTPTGVINTPYIQGSWVRVGSEVVSSAKPTITFPGLDGNRDVLYYISAQGKGTANCSYNINFNADSGSNYGYQYLRATSTTVDSARAATTSILIPGDDNGYYTLFNMLLFAKSGFLRPALINASALINGTTISGISSWGESWNNTSDNITSIVVSRSAGNFDVGSQFDLYALRPNG